MHAELSEAATLRPGAIELQARSATAARIVTVRYIPGWYSVRLDADKALERSHVKSVWDQASENFSFAKLKLDLALTVVDNRGREWNSGTAKLLPRSYVATFRLFILTMENPTKTAAPSLPT